MEKINETYPVSFVGTGPGDPELLTVRAKKRMNEADCIFYDCLPAEAVLRESAPNAKIIYVNKHPENGEPIPDILDLIQEKYTEGKKVVRLKAGDGMMFNGGDVEARKMKERGIPCEFIPGITAACAASNIFAIPTTEKFKSNAVVHLIADDISDNFEHIRAVAKLLEYGTTIALYMAYDNLQAIFDIFKQEGVDFNIPVVITSMISLSDEDCAKATMDTVFQVIEEREMLSPFVFFIGKYVDFYLSPKSKTDKLKSFINARGAMVH